MRFVLSVTQDERLVAKLKKQVRPISTPSDERNHVFGGFRVQGSGFRVFRCLGFWGLGVQGCRVSVRLGFRGLRALSDFDLGVGVWTPMFEVWGLGFGMQGLGFRV